MAEPGSAALQGVDLVNGATRAQVLPGRGSLVAALQVAGHDVLFMDAATLGEAGRPVRGGIPLLFPFAGRLEDDTLLPCHTSMPRHGFARDRRWKVRHAAAATVTTYLESDAETRRHYPFEFALTYTVEALECGIRIDLSIENCGGDPMPIAPGWHPYFAVASAAKTRALADVVSRRIASGEGDACDFNIRAPAGHGIGFAIDHRHRVSLTFCRELGAIQLWTLAGADFLCVEPCFGPPNIINTPDRGIVPPLQCARFWMRIELSVHPGLTKGTPS